MTAKEFLNRYTWLNKEIDSLLLERSRLRAVAEGTAGKPLGTIGGSGGRSDASANFTNAVHKIIAIEDKVNNLIDQLAIVRDEIENCFKNVTDPVQRVLLRYKYINGFTFERIAVEINYSYRNTHYLHSAALQKVNDIISSLHTIAR